MSMLKGLLRTSWLAVAALLAASSQLAMTAPGTFTSDDFNSHNLKRPLWTFTDPKNDATLAMAGVGSGNATISITVPAGTTHDLWVGGNFAPRIMQSVTANENFTAEARFTSPLSGVIYQKYQAQGILVEADANNLIRFDFTTGDQDSVMAFAAVFAGGFASPQVKIAKNIAPYGIAPLYVRVERTGNSWTMLYKTSDGAPYDTAGTFAHTLTVSKVGIFAVNAGTSPDAHTMVADYFFNADSPIVPEDPVGPVTDTQGPLVHRVRVKSAPNAFQVTWKTDEPADGVVLFGTSLPPGGSVSHPGYFYDHRLTISGLGANQVYNYQILGTDAASNTDGTSNATIPTGLYILDTLSTSDDFNGSSLNGTLWTFTNPRGDATANVSGGKLSISVPGGATHEPWTGGNTAPRIMQSLDVNLNVNEFRARFSSNLVGSATSIPLQGLMVMEDELNFIRLDVSNDGGTTTIFAASFFDGYSNPDVHINSPIPTQAGPIYLKLYRGGALWTASYSYDGVSWIEVGSFFRVLPATRAGVFAGNAGTSPQAFGCLVDYFVAARPAQPLLLLPVNGAPSVPTPVTVQWDTTAGATGYRLQVSTVANFATTVVDTVLSATSKVLGNLSGTTLYYWRVQARNGTIAGAYSSTSNFTTSVGAPGVPSLITPAADATNVPTNATFVWSKPATATSYRLQVATDSTFAGGIAVDDTTITDTTTTVSGLAPLTRHFWRVAAKNAGGYSAFSAVRPFTTAPPAPSVPVLLSPSNGATDVALSPVLRWRASSGAATYHLQVAMDSLFAGALVFDDSTLTDTSTVVIGLAATTPYYWRVRAKNVGGSSLFSSPWRFVTAPPPPGSPSQVSPPNGATDQSSSLTLNWTRPASATTFHLLLGTDSTFAGAILVNDSTIADTFKTVGGLAFNTKYFWKVAARNAGGESSFSPTWSFWTLPNDPAVPVQLEPLNGATNQPTIVNIRWTRPVGATSFRLQVATDPSFASGVVLDDPTLTDTVKTISGLSFMTTYYWRVNADNVGGTSPYSPTWNFTVGIPTPDQVQLVSPANQASIQGGTVQFVWRSSQPQVNRYWLEISIDPLFSFRTVDSTLTDTTKTVTGLSVNTTYYWRVRAGNAGSWGPYSDARELTITVVGVDDERGLPTEFALEQNYPNPFNPATRIEFALPRESRVTLEVFNLLGGRVALLLDEPRAAGYHTVTFDAADLPSGLYLYKLVAGQQVFTRKMMLVK